jgi:hypothetical protein
MLTFSKTKKIFLVYYLEKCSCQNLSKVILKSAAHVPNRYVTGVDNLTQPNLTQPNPTEPNRLKFPEGLIIGRGSLILGGLTPTPGPQGPLYQMEVFAMRIGWGPTNKSCSLGWVCLVKFNLLGAHSNQEPCRVHPTK